jgi:hypothetical protein
VVAELARGQVTDRPWGQTLGALGLRTLTGQLTLHAADGKVFQIAFDRGAVVGATSPLSGDSAARVALTNHLITSSQVTQIARQVAAHPGDDEFAILAQACQLDPDRALRLRQRVVAQRAARTFVVEIGSFVVHDVVTIPVARAAAIDIRAVIYLGVRMNLSEHRLAADLRDLGSHFTLKPEAEAELVQYGMTTSERPILEALRNGTTLPELEAKHRDVDPRSVQSIIYALVSCLACEATHTQSALIALEQRQPSASRASPVDGMVIKPPRGATDPPGAWTAIGTPSVPPSRTSTSKPPLPRTETPRRVYDDPTPRIDPRTRTASNEFQDRAVMFTPRAQTGGLPDATPPRGTTTPAVGRAPSQPPVTSRAVTGRTPTPSPEGRPSTQTSPPEARASTQTAPPQARVSTQTAPPQARVSTQPFARERTTSSHAITPGRTPSPQQPLAPRTPTPSAHAARKTSPSTNVPIVDPSGKPFDVEDGSVQRVVDPLSMAAEAYQRGQLLLREDKVQEAIEELTKAAELNPHEFDYSAVLAWAQFCGADDRTRIAEKVRKMLGYAIQKSRNPELARFYLGRMERMLGRYREAMVHFQRVVDADPRNTDAAAEIRALETKIAAGSGEKPGLASLFSRKKQP